MTIALLGLINLPAFAKPALEFEMTSKEYRALFEKMHADKKLAMRVSESPLNFILALGKRNLDWVEELNKHRDADHQLQLTTPEATVAYPIDHPGYSNPKIILQRLDALKNTMPKEMFDVIFSAQSLPQTTSIDDATFVINARLLDRIYQAASRWILQEPMLDEYTQLAQYDIRGYYYLSKEENLDKKLKYWKKLDNETKLQYANWLVNECNNAIGDESDCKSRLDQAIMSNVVDQYHQQYATQARGIFNTYFEIDEVRPEAVWNYQQPRVMDFPFTTPDRIDVRDWFKLNVEDEWHLKDWQLKISFANRPGLAKIVFESGTTPNAEGDVITMDANTPLNDYETSWTIRHEFGHILGFPDCYVEFYDAKNEVMINYQIDIDNLMCSRRGHLQATHYEQLKKYYYKGN